MVTGDRSRTSRRGPPVGLALGTLALLAVSACVVTAPQRAVWTCESDEDCVVGHACGARAGDPVRTCAPECITDEDCAAGARCLPSGVCALMCSFGTDGRPIVACPEGMSCGRLEYPLTSALGGDGLCGVTPTCATDEDCQGARPDAPTMICSSSSLLALRGIPNLLCLPLPGAAACPGGWVQSDYGCLPNCDASLATLACPPGMACYARRLTPVGTRASESACFYGFYGAPCRHDTECLLGECLEVAPGERQCTVPCDEAARLASTDRSLACATLRENAGPLGGRTVFDCSSPGANGVCVARGGVGSGCGDATACADDLSCVEGLCTRPCMTHEDCQVTGTVDPNPLASGFCDPTSSLCGRTLAEGSMCMFDAECETGLCATPALTIGTQRRCGRPRSVGSPCARDPECISRRCADIGLGGLRFCEER